MFCFYSEYTAKLFLALWLLFHLGIMSKGPGNLLFFGPQMQHPEVENTSFKTLDEQRFSESIVWLFLIHSYTRPTTYINKTSSLLRPRRIAERRAPPR